MDPSWVISYNFQNLIACQHRRVPFIIGVFPEIQYGTPNIRVYDSRTPNIWKLSHQPEHNSNIWRWFPLSAIISGTSILRHQRWHLSSEKLPSIRTMRSSDSSDFWQAAIVSWRCPRFPELVFLLLGHTATWGLSEGWTTSMPSKLSSHGETIKSVIQEVLGIVMVARIFYGDRKLPQAIKEKNKQHIFLRLCQIISYIYIHIISYMYIMYIYI